MQRRADICARALRDLKTIDRAALAVEDAISLDAVGVAMSDAFAGSRLGWGRYGFEAPRPYIVDQLNCAHTTVPAFLNAKHPINSKSDVADYLARLAAYAQVLDQETDGMRAEAARGVVPPTFVIEHSVDQLRSFVAIPLEQSPLVRSLLRRIATVAKMDASERQKSLAQAQSILRNRVLPACVRQIDALEAAHRTASDEPGVWRLKDGGEFYAVALRAWTTTARSPDEIHALGVELLRHLTDEMDLELKSLGRTRGTVGERMAELAADPAQMFPPTEEGRKALLRFLNGLIEQLQPLLPQYFGTLPKARLEIRRVPELNESGSSGGYYEAGALDGSRPGIYYINLRDTSEWPKFLLPTLTYHEGEPGHHWQISIAQESAHLPFIRSSILEFSGYVEGWGLYAEDLADEIGVYKNEPLAHLGYLQFAAFRAARLIVDTGIHAKRWGREKAIRFLIEATGRHPRTVGTEVDRYAVQPGQACTYMLGREEIRSLRREAQSRLGPRFDSRRFHDAVLSHGPLPLTILRTSVMAEA